MIPFVDEIRGVLLDANINFELILVANYDRGDTGDKTPEIARGLSKTDKNCMCVIEEKQGMMGWDLRSGLRSARGNYLAILDGDGQTPAADVRRLYDLMKSEGIDLGKIFRTHRADSVFRKCTSLVYNFLFNLFFPGLHIRDVNGKPKIMKRAAYESMHLVSNDWFIDAEIMLEARRLKLRVMEIPGISQKNKWRKSFIGIGAIIQFIKNILVYRIRYSGLR